MLRDLSKLPAVNVLFFAHMICYVIYSNDPLTAYEVLSFIQLIYSVIYVNDLSKDLSIHICSVLALYSIYLGFILPWAWKVLVQELDSGRVRAGAPALG